MLPLKRLSTFIPRSIRSLNLSVAKSARASNSLSLVSSRSLTLGSAMSILSIALLISSINAFLTGIDFSDSSSETSSVVILNISSNFFVLYFYLLVVHCGTVHFHPVCGILFRSDCTTFLRLATLPD